MLVCLLALSGIFLIEPIIQDYPRDARIFPQMMAGAVFTGCLLLLVQKYLPGPIQTFVAEDMTITSTDDTLDSDEKETADEEMTEEPVPRLGEEYGLEVNDTLFMVITAMVYLIAGWAIGFLFVTLPFVFLYMVWFRIPWHVALGLGLAATVVIWFFMTFLILPFDRGAIIDLSPLVPFVVDVVGPLASGSVETVLNLERGVI